MLFGSFGSVAQTSQDDEETLVEWVTDYLKVLIGLSTDEEGVQRAAFEDMTGYQWYIERNRVSTKESAQIANKSLKEIGDSKRASGKYIIVIATLDESDEGITITLEGETAGGKLTPNKINKLIEDAEKKYLTETVLDWGEVDEALSVMEVNLRQSILEELGIEEQSIQPDTIYVNWAIDTLFVNNEINILGSGTNEAELIGQVPGSGTVIVIDVIGNMWVVDSGGNVTQGGGSSSSSGGSSSGEATTPSDSTTIESLSIVGLSRNVDLVAIHSVAESFKPEEERLSITYSLQDTLDLAYTKLEIFKIDEDTTMVTFFTDLPRVSEEEFTDTQDGDSIGWSGKGPDGEYIKAGDYMMKLTAAIDESFSNGYEDYEGFKSNAPDFPVTADQFEEIFPDTDKERIKEVVDLINKYSNEYGLTTKNRMAHFLGQIGTETDGLEKLKESSNYSGNNVFSVFLRVKRTKEEGTTKTHKYCDLIEDYTCSDLTSCPSDYQGPHRCSTEPDYEFPTKEDGSPDYDKWVEDDNSVKSTYINSSSLFDYVYSCRMGNGSKSTEDGSTYLGKGFIHMTGKDKYERVSIAWNKKYPNDKKEFHGDDIDELENNVEIAMKASLVLWEEDEMNDFADEGTDLAAIKAVTKEVNGGSNGLSQRKKYTEKAVEVFDSN